MQNKQHAVDKPEYSERFLDDTYEYRYVILPREMANELKQKKILTEEEWRGMGIQQSRGWVHFGFHKAEPHILLFKRPLGTDPKTGQVSAEMLKRHYEMVEEQRMRLIDTLIQ